MDRMPARFRTHAAVLTAACLFGGCGRVAGPSADTQSGASVSVSSSRGSPIGRLRLVDPLPCYELFYEASYRIADLAKPVACIPAGRSLREAACTCFSGPLPGGRRVFGRNFDWDPNPALVLLTRPKDGYASISLVDISYLGFSGSRSPFDAPDGLAEAWRIPFDGMNEKGFAVGMMAVDHAEGPQGTGRPRVGELGIMRVLLDRAASVDEAIQLMGAHEVAFDAPPLHYFLADRTGDVAVVEFVGGRLQVIRNGTPWMVSTNFLLAEVPPPARDSACWRYAAASTRLREGKGLPGADGAMDLLEAVSVPRTRWSAVYELDPGHLTLVLGRRYGRTHRWTLP